MVLYGFGGHGRVLADCLESSGAGVSAVFDDNLLAADCPYPLSGVYNPEVQDEDFIILAIGDNRTRKMLAGIVKHAAGKIVHSSAIVSSLAVIGAGTVVLHRVVVQANAIIGQHCIINTGAIVEHDCRIHDFAHIAPGAIICGGVEIGEGSLIGAGAVVLPGVKVGADCVAGAGAVVTKAVPDGHTVAGNPARKLK